MAQRKCWPGASKVLNGIVQIFLALPSTIPHTENPFKLLASEDTTVFGALVLLTISTNSSPAPLGPSNRNSEIIIPVVPRPWAALTNIAVAVPLVFGSGKPWVVPLSWTVYSKLAGPL